MPVLGKEYPKVKPVIGIEAYVEVIVTMAVNADRSGVPAVER